MNPLRTTAVRRLMLVLPTLLLAVLLPLVFPTAATAQAGGDEAWRPCELPSEDIGLRKVEIIFAIDLSGSLRRVDPGGTQRRQALERVRTDLLAVQMQLEAVLTVNNSLSGSPIHVGLIGFDTEWRIIAPLGPLSENHPSDEQIEEAVADGTGDTDYGPAIEGAQALFDSSPDAGATDVCRVFVLFTDGILDPLNSVAGGGDDVEAESLAENLLREFCGAEADPDRYRVSGPNLSSYAVLLGPGFDQGAPGSHRERMATASKQLLLALTGHYTSPFVEGLDPHPNCVAWSTERAGSIIELDDIDALTDALADVVDEVRRGLVRPRLFCPFNDVQASIVGEWPGKVRLGDDGAPVCTVTAPLAGWWRLIIASTTGPDDIEWEFDPPLQFNADGARTDFTITTEDLPDDVRLGAFPGAEVVIQLDWTDSPPGEDPDLAAAKPVRDATLRFDIPDREQHFKPALRCTDSVPASVTETRAEVYELCTLQPPPGDTEITLPVALGDGGQSANELTWRLTVEGKELDAGDTLSVRSSNGGWQATVNGEEFAAGEGLIRLGAVSRLFTESDKNDFTDVVSVTSRWVSALGVPLIETEDSHTPAITVSQLTPMLVQCGTKEADQADADEAKVAAFVLGTHALEQDRIVVKTGCRLLAQSRGTVVASVEGNVDGVAWELAVPAGRGTDGADTWRFRESPQADPDTGNRDVYLYVEEREEDSLRGKTGSFKIRATWTPPDEDPRHEDDSGEVTLDWPTLTCDSSREAERKPVAPAEDGRRRSRADVPAVCEVEAPPNGSVEVLLASDEPEPSWCLVLPENATAGLPCNDPPPVLLVPGDPPFQLGLATEALVDEDWLTGFSRDLRVTLRWDSVTDHVSTDSRPVNVEAPPPGLLARDGDPTVLSPGDEVPEGPLVVDTGCTLPPPTDGTVELSVDGEVAGVPWRLPAPVLLSPGDAEHRVIIESDGPLPDERLQTTATFTLTATWRGADGFAVKAGVCPGAVEIDLEERSDPRWAVIIALAILAGALLLAWLYLWLLRKLRNRLPPLGSRWVRFGSGTERSNDGKDNPADFWVITDPRAGHPDEGQVGAILVAALGDRVVRLPAEWQTLPLQGSRSEQASRTEQGVYQLRVRARMPRPWKVGELLSGGGYAEVVGPAGPGWTVLAAPRAGRGNGKPTLPLNLPPNAAVVVAIRDDDANF